MFEIYGKNNCVWCDRAKSLLSSKGLPFKYLELGKDFDLEELYEAFGSVKTLPQISHDFGGYTGWGIIGTYEDLVKWLKHSTEK